MRYIEMPYELIGKFMEDLRASVFHGANGYCPICASPHRAEIEAARRADNGVVGLRSHPSATSYPSIAARFGVHAGAIWRHFRRGHEQRPPMAYMKRPKSSYALDLIILTAVRKDQVLGAEWMNINWEERTLTSPVWRESGEQGHKTGKKTKVDYITPLSDPAMEILRTMKKWQEDSGIKSKFVFCSEGNPHGKKSPGSKMSHHTVNAPAKRLGERLGEPDITVHGFRTTFGTWATDQGYPENDIEMQLGHIVGNPVRNKYKDKRVVLRIKERRKMMEDWADYCSKSEPVPAPDATSSRFYSAEIQP
jgi:Phage integrase family